MLREILISSAQNHKRKLLREVHVVVFPHLAHIRFFLNPSWIAGWLVSLDPLGVACVMHNAKHTHMDTSSPKAHLFNWPFAPNRYSCTYIPRAGYNMCTVEQRGGFCAKLYRFHWFGASHCNARTHAARHHKLIFYYHESASFCAWVRAFSPFFGWRCALLEKNLLSHFVNKWDVSSSDRPSIQTKDWWICTVRLLLWCINCAENISLVALHSRDENSLYICIALAGRLGSGFCICLSHLALCGLMHYWDLSPSSTQTKSITTQQIPAQGLQLGSDCSRGFYPSWRSTLEATGVWKTEQSYWWNVNYCDSRVDVHRRTINQALVIIFNHLNDSAKIQCAHQGAQIKKKALFFEQLTFWAFYIFNQNSLFSCKTVC